MVTINSLLSSPALGGLKVIAGSSGLEREVSAVSVMDAPDSYKWLKGGEFILTTGYLFGGDEWQFEHFISNLVKANCSAAGVKKGRFIGNIPQNVIQIAEHNSFPIIEIPYNYGWSEIFNAYYAIKPLLPAVTDAILRQQPQKPEYIAGSNNEYYSNLLQKLYANNISDLDYNHFDDKPDLRKRQFCVLLFNGYTGDEIAGNLEHILTIPCICNNFRINKYITDIHDGKIAIVLLEAVPKRSDNDNYTFIKWQYLLYKELDCFFYGKTHNHISMGRIYPDIQGIINSYKEAAQALLIGQAIWADKSFFYYPLLSAYAGNQHTDDTADMYDYVNVLLHHQRKDDFDIIQCLESFLEDGWKKAASKLYVHKNTLRYRIQKIEDLLCLDFSDNAVANSLLTQIKQWRLKNN